MRKYFWHFSLFLLFIVFTSMDCNKEMILKDGIDIPKDKLTEYTLNWEVPPDSLTGGVSEYTVEFYVLADQSKNLAKDVFRLDPVYETTTRDNKISLPAELAQNLQERQVVQWDITAKSRRRSMPIGRGMFGIEGGGDFIEWPSPQCYSCRNVLTEVNGNEECVRECKYVPNCIGTIPNTHDATWDLDHDGDGDSGSSALRDSDRFSTSSDEFPIVIETTITISVPCNIVNTVSTVRVLGHIFNGNSKVPTGDDLSIDFWLPFNEPGVSHADSVTVDSSLYIRSCTEEGMICTVPLFCRVVYDNNSVVSQLPLDQHIVVQVKDLEHNIPDSCQTCRDNFAINRFDYFTCLDTCDSHMDKHILIHKFKSGQDQVLEM